MKFLFTFWLAGCLSFFALNAKEAPKDAPEPAKHGQPSARVKHDQPTTVVQKQPSRSEFETFQLVLVLNENNPINNLTSHQIELLFSGDAGDWVTVRDEKDPLRVYAPGPLNESHKAFLKLGFKERTFGPNVQLFDDENMILARVSKSKNAVGVVKYPFTRTKGVKVIAVDGFSPIIQNYPYTVTYDVLYEGGETTTHAKHDIHWSYEGDTGTAHWGDISPAFELCKTGMRQSPIDLVNPDKKEGKPLEFKYAPSKINLVNNGHTIQQNYDAGSYVIFKDKKFFLKQFHFHSSSEHTVMGEPFNLEIHLVHAAEDGELLVVGVLFNRGPLNRFLGNIFPYLPENKDQVFLSNETINAQDVLPKNLAVYNYSGSLTTPPGTEGVNWFVFEEPATLSPVQLVTFQKLYSKNFRPVQPLNNRSLILYEGK